jgi:hypothetical protein
MQVTLWLLNHDSAVAGFMCSIYILIFNTLNPTAYCLYKFVLFLEELSNAVGSQE